MIGDLPSCTTKRIKITKTTKLNFSKLSTSCRWLSLWLNYKGNSIFIIRNTDRQDNYGNINADFINCTPALMVMHIYYFIDLRDWVFLTQNLYSKSWMCSVNSSISPCPFIFIFLLWFYSNIYVTRLYDILLHM